MVLGFGERDIEKAESRREGLNLLQGAHKHMSPGVAGLVVEISVSFERN